MNYLNVNRMPAVVYCIDQYKYNLKHTLNGYLSALFRIPPVVSQGKKLHSSAAGLVTFIARMHKS